MSDVSVPIVDTDANKTIILTTELSVVKDVPSGLNKLIINATNIEKSDKESSDTGLWINSENLNKLPTDQNLNVTDNNSLKEELLNAFKTTDSAITSAVYTNEEKNASVGFQVNKVDANAAYNDRSKNVMIESINTSLTKLNDVNESLKKNLDQYFNNIIALGDTQQAVLNIKQSLDIFNNSVNNDIERIGKFISATTDALTSELNEDKVNELVKSFEIKDEQGFMKKKSPSEYLYKLTNVILDLTNRMNNKLNNYNENYIVALGSSIKGRFGTSNLVQYTPKSGIIKTPITFDKVMGDIGNPNEEISEKNINAKFKSDLGVLRGFQTTAQKASNWMQYRTDIDTAKGLRPHLGEGYLQQRQAAADKANVSTRKRWFGFGGKRRTRKSNKSKTSKKGKKKRANKSGRK